MTSGDTTGDPARGASSRRERVRSTRLVGAFIAVALAVVAARVVIDSASALRRGDAAAGRGESAEAIQGYLEAARLYAPASPYPPRALDRLSEMAERAEASGDLVTARQALEAAHGAILGTRSFYTPFAGRLPALERRLVGLYVRLDPYPTAHGPSWYAARLAVRPGPSVALSVLALVGFFAWVGAALAFLLRAFDSSLRLRPRPALLCAAVFVVGFALFLAGLRLA